MTTKNDMYKVDVPGEKDLQIRYRSEDELNDNLKTLKEDHRDIVKEYKILNAINSKDHFHSIQDEVQAVIDKVERLEGELYTREGKKAEIRKQIKKIAETKRSEANKKAKNAMQQQIDLLEKMDKEINSHDEFLTSDQV